MKKAKEQGLTITCHDPVHCRIPKDRIPLLRKAVEYPDSNWRQGQFAMEKKNRTASYIDGRGGLFLSGLLHRIRKYAKSKNLKVKIEGSFEKINASVKPHLTGFTLRDYQATGVDMTFKKQRGLIISPTGTGKTVTMGGIVSCIPDRNVLILMHTIDLQQQTYERFSQFGFPSLQLVGGIGGKKFLILKNQGHVVIALIQTYSKLNLKKLATVFDAIIVDEAHHVISTKSQYGKVLAMSLAPIRIGFTATIPKNKKSLYALEGLLGPKIHELPDDEAQDMGVLAKPTIKLINTPYSVNLADKHRKYRDLYKHAIVGNKRRNRLILRHAKRFMGDGKSVLIMVKDLAHKDLLLELGEDKFKIKIKAVHGSVDADMRTKTKNLLNSKKCKCVISTVVWREGVDIPELDVVINACGGKSEIMTLQALGRGRRVTATKKKLIVIDFLDPYKFLAEHSIKRLQIYVEKGWL